MLACNLRREHRVSLQSEMDIMLASIQFARFIWLFILHFHRITRQMKKEKENGFEATNQLTEAATTQLTNFNSN